MAFDQLKQKWLAALNDPLQGPAQALLLTETKSPWGWRQSLQPSVINHATNGDTVNLIGPAASGAGNRKLTVPSQEVLIIEQLDYWYQENAGEDLTAAINGAKLQLLINSKGDRRLPTFTLDYFARGDSVLRFGKLPLGWVVPVNGTVALNMIPSGTAGGVFDVYVDLLIRREPLWLMEAAGLVQPSRPGRQ